MGSIPIWVTTSAKRTLGCPGFNSRKSPRPGKVWACDGQRFLLGFEPVTWCLRGHRSQYYLSRHMLNFAKLTGSGARGDTTGMPRAASRTQHLHHACITCITRASRRGIPVVSLLVLPLSHHDFLFLPNGSRFVRSICMASPSPKRKVEVRFCCCCAPVLLLQTLMPCCPPPRHVSPNCHPAARAQSSFPLREAAFWDVQKEHPPPRARCPGALGL